MLCQVSQQRRILKFLEVGGPFALRRLGFKISLVNSSGFIHSVLFSTVTICELSSSCRSDRLAESAIDVFIFRLLLILTGVIFLLCPKVVRIKDRADACVPMIGRLGNNWWSNLAPIALRCAAVALRFPYIACHGLRLVHSSVILLNLR